MSEIRIFNRKDRKGFAKVAKKSSSLLAFATFPVNIFISLPQRKSHIFP